MLGTSQFVGRAELVEDVLAHLHEHQLVTLLGPGGVGKTRIAEHVAAQVRAVGSLAADVVVVRLANEPAGDASLFDSAVVRAFGIPDNRILDGDVAERIAGHIGERTVLLVLDNAEHVIAPARRLIRPLLDLVPSLRVLLTSRVVLELGEKRVHVPPLAHSDGVRLLTDRAELLGVEIWDVEAVRELVTLLNGLPLAIEIAASHLDVMTPREIVDELAADALYLLDAVEYATAYDHHRTLRATMDWSWGLLSPGDRVMWVIMSEFRGSPTVDALRHVGEAMGLSGQAALGSVAKLVKHSIFLRREGPGSIRAEMLDSCRRYGQGIELEDVSREKIAAVHAAYYEARVHDGAATWWGRRELEVLRELNVDLPNVRAALGHMRETGQCLRGLRMALAYGESRCMLFAGRLAEGERLLGPFLEPQPDQPTVEDARTQATIAFLAYLKGRPAEGDLALARANAVLEDLGLQPPSDVVRTEGLRMTYAPRTPDESKDAAAMFDRAAAMAGDAGCVSEQAYCTMLAVIADAHHGSGAAVIERARRHVAEAEIVGAQWALAWARWALALAELLHGSIRRAAAELRRAAEDHGEMRELWWLTWAAWIGAVITARTGDAHIATRLFGASRGLQEMIDCDIAGLAPMWRLQPAAESVCVRELGERRFRKVFLEAKKTSSEEILRLLRSSLHEPTRAVDRNPGGLGDRELQVARLVAAGMTNKEIAANLHTAARTVEHQVLACRRKLGARNRIELAQMIRELDHRRTSATPAPLDSRA